MKKQEFNITTREGVRSKTGYIYQVGEFWFGVSGKSGNYSVTELKTGTFCPLKEKIKRLDEIPDKLVDFIKNIKASNLRSIIDKNGRFDFDFDDWEVVLMADWEWYTI